MNQPNILFILSDQHSAKVMGHAGHPDVKTPRLDRLAAEGIRFTRAITPNPICSPTRVSLLSGQFCHNHGYYGLDGPLTSELPNIFGHFHNFGYRTGIIGKVHLPKGWIDSDCDVLLDQSYYDTFINERGLSALKDDILYPEQDPSIGQSWDGRKSSLDYEDSVEAWIARETRSFIEECTRDGKPFILQASMPRPHQIHAPSGEFWDMYEGDLTLPPNADAELSQKAPHLRKLAKQNRDGHWTQFEPRTFHAGRLRKLRGYLGLVSQMDFAIGQILDLLDELKIADNTIVIYTSDHGEYVTEFGIMEKAPGICSDAVCRVPMIWKVPGTATRGLECNALVQSIDWVDTVCALAGVSPMAASDGVDLSPLLTGEANHVREVALTEHPWSKSIYKGKWRYVHYPQGMFAEYPDGFGELYKMDDDPYEMHNLWFSPEHASIVAEMKSALLDCLITTTRCRSFVELHTSGSLKQIIKHHVSAANDGKLSPREFSRLSQQGTVHYL